MERNKSTRFSVMAAAVAVVVVFLFSPSATLEAVFPVQKAVRFLNRRILSPIAGAFRAVKVQSENISLRRDVAGLAVLVDELARLEEENNRLRQVVGYKARLKGNFVAATVITRVGGIVENSNIIRVDKGSGSGVKENSVVIVPEGLVGKVIRVTENTSEILLITDPRLKVSCSIEYNAGEVLGVLSGGINDLLSIRHLMGNVNMLSSGARVKTSGLGGVFPEGFSVGTYLGEGYVRPFVDFSSLEDVFIRYEK